MNIKEKNLKLFFELIFIFLLPFVLIVMNINVKEVNVYDDHNNLVSVQKNVIYSGLDFNHNNVLVDDSFIVYNYDVPYRIYEFQCWESTITSFNDFLDSIPDNLYIINDGYYYVEDIEQGDYFGISFYEDYYDVYSESDDEIFDTYGYGITRFGFNFKDFVYSFFNDFVLNYYNSQGLGLDYLSYLQSTFIFSGNLYALDTVNVTKFDDSDSGLMTKIKYLICNLLNINADNTIVNIVIDYNCLWILAWLIWHFIYVLIDYLTHFIDSVSFLKKR